VSLKTEILQENDSLWIIPDRVRRQELAFVMGGEHILFSTSKIGSLVDANQSK
jgi:protein mago nashi